MHLDVVPTVGLTTNLLTEFTDSGVDGATETAFYSTRSKIPANLDFESR